MAKRVFIYVVGWAFVLLGIVGLFLPILQGFLFLLVGLLILSKESRIAKYFLFRIRRRYPVQYRKMHEFNLRIKKRFRSFVKD